MARKIRFLILILFLFFSCQAIQARPARDSIQSLAHDLVTKLNKGGDSTLPSLRQAILLSGIGIREADEKIIRLKVPQQGMVLNHWEVEGMAAIYKNGMHLSFADFISVVASVTGAKDSLAIGKIIIDEIKVHANGENSSYAFWAKFLLELSLQDPFANDLSKPDFQKLQLNAIQVSLLLQRIAADILLWAIKDKLLSLQPTKQSIYATANPLLTFAKAESVLNIKPVSTAFFNVVRPPQQGSSEIKLLPGCAGLDEIILEFKKIKGGDTTTWKIPFPNPDEMAAGLTLGMDKFMGYLSKHGMPGLEKISQRLSIANAILAYVKLFTTYAALKIDISMEAPSFLIRTCGSSPGQTKDLTAFLHYDGLEDMQFVNCIRMALNLKGIDFELPQNGPVKDASVQWRMTEGGRDKVIKEDGNIQVQHALVYFDNPSVKKTKDPDYTESITSDNGKSTIKVTGAPHNPQLLADKIVPVEKQFDVFVRVQMEQVELRGAVTDVGQAVVGGVLGVLGFLPEMLYKSHWYSSEEKSFPVIDWEYKWGVDEVIYDSYHLQADLCNGLDQPFIIRSTPTPRLANVDIKLPFGEYVFFPDEDPNEGSWAFQRVWSGFIRNKTVGKGRYKLTRTEDRILVQMTNISWSSMVDVYVAEENGGYHIDPFAKSILLSDEHVFPNNTRFYLRPTAKCPKLEYKCP